MACIICCRRPEGRNATQHLFLKKGALFAALSGARVCVKWTFLLTPINGTFFRLWHHDLACVSFGIPYCKSLWPSIQIRFLWCVIVLLWRVCRGDGVWTYLKWGIREHAGTWFATWEKREKNSQMRMSAIWMHYCTLLNRSWNVSILYSTAIDFSPKRRGCTPFEINCGLIMCVIVLRSRHSIKETCYFDLLHKHQSIKCSTVTYPKVSTKHQFNYNNLMYFRMFNEKLHAIDFHLHLSI